MAWQNATGYNWRALVEADNEALDLALGLRPVRAAQLRQKAVVMGKVAEPGL